MLANSASSVNFLMFDFIDYDPQLLKFVIGLNFKLSIRVKLAKIELLSDTNTIVKQVDVTD